MSFRPALFAVAMLSVLGACESLLDTFEPDADTIPLADIIDLRRAGGHLPLTADGAASDTIIAALPMGATTRLVKFTTTRGSFARTGGQKAIDVRADREGEALVARAVLVSDTIPGTATVRGSVGEFSNYLEVTFVER